jgi:hypothetical protein
MPPWPLMRYTRTRTHTHEHARARTHARTHAHTDARNTAPQNNLISPKPPVWHRVARARPELLAHAHVGRKLPPARNPPIVNPKR